MSENNSCPICSSTFIPADGLSAEEHLARGIIAIYKKLQDKAEYEGCSDSLNCPKCGKVRMNEKVSRNALSRHADIQICDICGVDEAALVFAGTPLPLFDWWVVKEVLTLNKPEQESESNTGEQAQAAEPSQKRKQAPKKRVKPKRTNRLKGDT